MPEITCIRLVDYESPAAPLAQVVSSLAEGVPTDHLYIIEAESFQCVPNAPFAYKVNHRVLALYKNLPHFETRGRTARQGLATTDDFRFLRCWWEVSPHTANQKEKKWYPFAKGGTSTPFFSDVHLVVNWARGGEEIKQSIVAKYPYLNGNPGFVAKNTDFYFRPGITWPSLPHLRGSFSIVPRGCIFGHSGPMLFSNEGETLVDAAILNSTLFGGLLHLLMPRGVGGENRTTLKYEVGYVTSVPIVEITEPAKGQIEESVRTTWNSLQFHFSHFETSHNYAGPATFGYKYNVEEFADTFGRINETVRSAASLNEADLKQLSQDIGRDYARHEFNEDWRFEPQSNDLSWGLLSHAVGLVFGRFASFDRVDFVPYTESDEFPVAPPAVRPLVEGRLWIDGCNDDGISSKIESLFKRQSDERYAAVLNYILESGFSGFEEFFRKPSGFFSRHVVSHSASRRCAPIYWPLSTRSGDFVIWVYYPKFDEDALPRLITEVLDPRLRRLNEELATLAGDGKASARRVKLEALRLELAEMRQDFQDLIAKGYRPNLNDGVIITACPLAKYFRLPKFRKDLEDCWKKLTRGDFDWAHLAMSMWPERVTEACRRDRSIAIAHGKEDLCPAAPPKAKRGLKKAK